MNRHRSMYLEWTEISNINPSAYPTPMWKMGSQPLEFPRQQARNSLPYSNLHSSFPLLTPLLRSPAPRNLQMPRSSLATPGEDVNTAVNINIILQHPCNQYFETRWYGWKKARGRESERGQETRRKEREMWKRETQISRKRKYEREGRCKWLNTKHERKRTKDKNKEN